MKRNLFILSLSVLIFSVLMISMVYAGWFGFTGNSVKEFQNSANIDLKKGLANKINLDGEEIFVKAPIIEKDSVMININGEIKEVKKGSPITIGDYEVQFISSEKGFLSRTKSKVKISKKKAILNSTNTNSNWGNSTNGSWGNFAQQVTYQGVLNMLNSCRIATVSSTDVGSPLVNVSITCNEICDYYADNIWNFASLTCITGYFYVGTATGSSQLIDCDVPGTIPFPSQTYYQRNCICCSP